MKNTIFLAIVFLVFILYFMFRLEQMSQVIVKEKKNVEKIFLKKIHRERRKKHSQQLEVVARLPKAEINYLENKEKSSKAVLIVIYLGNISDYHQFVFKSFSLSKCYDMLILTDNPHLKSVAEYQNIMVEYIPDLIQNVTESLYNIYSLDKTKNQENLKNLTEQIKKKPHKLCQIKPVYGRLCENYIRDYYYWGWVDIDILVFFKNKFFVKQIFFFFTQKK